MIFKNKKAEAITWILVAIVAVVAIVGVVFMTNKTVTSFVTEGEGTCVIGPNTNAPDTVTLGKGVITSNHVCDASVNGCSYCKAQCALFNNINDKFGCPSSYTDPAEALLGINGATTVTAMVPEMEKSKEILRQSDSTSSYLLTQKFVENWDIYTLAQKEVIAQKVLDRKSIAGGQFQQFYITSLSGQYSFELASIKGDLNTYKSYLDTTTALTAINTENSLNLFAAVEKATSLLGASTSPVTSSKLVAYNVQSDANTLFTTQTLERSRSVVTLTGKFTKFYGHDNPEAYEFSFNNAVK
mgnify:CR=1 FL=1